MIKTDELPDINTTAPYCTILAALRLGAEKAKPVKDLCSLTGLSDRILRKHIETMRLAGTCICSNKDGYYLPMTENELQHYIAKMEQTAMKCRANNSVQRREFKRVRNDVTDETLSFCAHACFLSLLDIFHWSVDKCFEANREMNKQFHQIINKNTALNDYSAILKQDYNYSAAKVRVKIFDKQQAAEEWDRKAIELRKVCFYRYITVAIVVLRDKFGWGASMCDKYQSAMNRWLSKYTRGDETLESMNQKLNERGINLTCGSARDRRCG